MDVASDRPITGLAFGVFLVLMLFGAVIDLLAF
jgi:hypothetical protein